MIPKLDRQRHRADWVERLLVREVSRRARRGEMVSDEEFGRKTEAVGNLIVTDFPDSLAKRLIETAPDAVADNAMVRLGFEARLHELWGPAFDLLDALIIAASEMGWETHRSDLRAAVAEQDLVVEAAHRLHARSCQLAHQILTLMRAGFAMGAMSRVRALQENVSVMRFISEHGRDTADRFLVHPHMSAYRAALEHNRHAEQLGMAEIEPETIERMKDTCDRIVAQFDQPCFGFDYGWALKALGRECSSAIHATPKPKRHRVSYADIEKRVDLDRYRPYYTLASGAIHADPRFLYWDLGLRDQRTLLYGGSNDGFADPTQLTARFIALSVADLNAARPGTASRTIAAGALQRFIPAIDEALAASMQELDERVRRHPPGEGGRARRKGLTPRVPHKAGRDKRSRPEM
jgi:Family of unknown function (DUF5677)